MPVTLWAVLGLVLLLWGLPFAFLSYLPYSTGQLNFTAGITIGAGVAFLTVALVQWIVERNRALPTDDADPDPS